MGCSQNKFYDLKLSMERRAGEERKTIRTCNDSVRFVLTDETQLCYAFRMTKGEGCAILHLFAHYVCIKFY